jgi:hypothetical protein
MDYLARGGGHDLVGLAFRQLRAPLWTPLELENTNFLEHRKAEVRLRRICLLRASVNKPRKII